MSEQNISLQMTDDQRINLERTIHDLVIQAVVKKEPSVMQTTVPNKKRPHGSSNNMPVKRIKREPTTIDYNAVEIGQDAEIEIIVPEVSMRRK